MDAKTARCVSRAAFNELTSWCAVDARVFELKQLGVETRKLESRRFEMPKAGVAAELDAAMRSRVRLYVERPDEVRRLRATGGVPHRGRGAAGLARTGSEAEAARRRCGGLASARGLKTYLATFGRKAPTGKRCRVGDSRRAPRAPARPRRAARPPHRRASGRVRDGRGGGLARGKKREKRVWDVRGRRRFGRRACARARVGGRARAARERTTRGRREAFEDKGARARARASDAFSFSVETEGGRLPAGLSRMRPEKGSAFAARARTRASARAPRAPGAAAAALRRDAGEPARAGGGGDRGVAGGADYFYEDEAGEDDETRVGDDAGYVPVPCQRSPGGGSRGIFRPAAAGRPRTRGRRVSAGGCAGSRVCCGMASCACARARADADVRAGARAGGQAPAVHRGGRRGGGGVRGLKIIFFKKNDVPLRGG